MMSDQIENIADQILTNKIERREAIKRFEALPEEHKGLLVSRLKSAMKKNGNALITGRVQRRSLVRRRAVTEREIDNNHQHFIDRLAAEMAEFAPKSKENALRYQERFVDQRRVAHLKKSLKPVQFSLTYDRGEGAYLYDIDGNCFVDVTGDNGVNIFGHQPAFVKDAVKSRVDKGLPLVGYTEELFDAVDLFCELTGHERALFTQSGTEAVMWAVRIARAATQKKKIVIFEGSYHGLSDAVVAFKDRFGRSQSPALGVLQEFADQLIVLDYGDPAQLDTIERRSGEIAGVLVEPVQSRNPTNQPAEFLQTLRNLTLEKNIPLIFDEMITGFRVCPRGAQGYFGIRADIATYGKVPGGGMPTGIIGGAAKYMDLVDGGTWQYDDDSMPSFKRTLMAGTHTRNPVKIAATRAVLNRIKQECTENGQCDSCSCFQKDLSKKTRDMANELNAYFEDGNFPLTVEYFGSLFKFVFLDDPNGLVNEMFLVLLRLNGVETSQSGNFFLTTAHTTEDIRQMINAVQSSIDRLDNGGFFSESPLEPADETDDGVFADDEVSLRKTSDQRVRSEQLEMLRSVIKTELENVGQGSI